MNLLQWDYDGDGVLSGDLSPFGNEYSTSSCPEIGLEDSEAVLMDSYDIDLGNTPEYEAVINLANADPWGDEFQIELKGSGEYHHNFSLQMSVFRMDDDQFVVWPYLGYSNDDHNYAGWDEMDSVTLVSLRNRTTSLTEFFYKRTGASWNGSRLHATPGDVIDVRIELHMACEGKVPESN